MELTRRDQILKMIVEQFIKTGNPVGSQTLIDEFHLNCSSATIRNEMFILEKEGYLEKTHTSSGRVPSSLGYRYYVEYLRDKGVDDSIKQQLTTVFSKRSKSVDEVIGESCQILSHMTNLASVVLGPNAEEEHLVSIQMIPISENTMTAVFVTDQGYVENKTFILDESMSVKDIENCIKLLNDRLKGTSISRLIEKMEAMKPLIEDYVSKNELIFNVFMDAFIKFASERVNFYGKGELLEQPDFVNDIEKFKKVVKLLDSPEEFLQAINRKDSDVNVSIGELGHDYEDVSIITSKVSMPGKSDGHIAIIGPKRMDYSRVINALTSVVDELEKYFQSERNKNGES